MDPFAEYTPEELELIALECGDQLRGVANRWQATAARNAPEAATWEALMTAMMDEAAINLGIKGD